ncbi:unnamed protein product [Musa hybrid cultivar]
MFIVLCIVESCSKMISFCFLKITRMFKSSLVVDCIFSNIVEEFSGRSNRLESMFSREISDQYIYMWISRFRSDHCV